MSLFGKIHCFDSKYVIYVNRVDPNIFLLGGGGGGGGGSGRREREKMQAIFFFFANIAILTCNFFFFEKLFIFIINQRHAINHCIVCWHVTLKKAISYITSYFSQILTELHRYKIN